MMTSNLTLSEWEVMKALWENAPLTAGAIVKKVSIENPWAKTTINSFILRLLEKGYINFTHDHQYREYYPIFTEKECVNSKMQKILKSFYGRRLNKETKYFEFYEDNDTDFLAILVSKADEGYERITHILKCDLDDKLQVYLHRTQKRFHSVMGIPNAAEWYRAGHMWGMIHMAPLKHFTDLTADKALLHVFTQLLVSHINENCPYYIHQGVSAYLAQWLDKTRIRKALIENRSIINLNTLRSFVFDLENFKSSAGYELSYVFISFIVSKYGNDSLRKMIDEPYDIPRLFHIEENVLLSELQIYIESQFID